MLYDLPPGLECIAVKLCQNGIFTFFQFYKMSTNNATLKAWTMEWTDGRSG